MTATTKNAKVILDLTSLITELERKVPARMNSRRTETNAVEFRQRTNEYMLLIHIANTFIRWMDQSTLYYSRPQNQLDEIRCKIQRGIQADTFVLEDDLRSQLLDSTSPLYSLTPDGIHVLYERLRNLDRYFEEL